QVVALCLVSKNLLEVCTRIVVVRLIEPLSCVKGCPPDQTGNTSTALDAVPLPLAARDRAISKRAQSLRVQALGNHFPFRRLSERVLDLGRNADSIPNLLDEAQVMRVRGACAEGADASVRQRRVDRDEPVLWDIQHGLPDIRLEFGHGCGHQRTHAEKIDAPGAHLDVVGWLPPLRGVSYSPEPGEPEAQASQYLLLSPSVTRIGMADQHRLLAA